MIGPNLFHQIPDEIVEKIITSSDTLKDKLRMELIDKRFQRCLLKCLKRDGIHFELNEAIYDPSSTHTRDWQNIPRLGLTMLNGYWVHGNTLHLAVKNLSTKCTLITISMHLETENGYKSVAQLVETTEVQLERVTAIEIGTNGRLHENYVVLIEQLLSRCPKTIRLVLDDHFHPASTDFRSAAGQMNNKLVMATINLKSKPLDLDRTMDKKSLPLRELEINLVAYTQKQIIDLFQHLKPNTLKTLYLRLSFITLDSTVFLKQLSAGAWQSLEHLRLRCYEVRIHLGHFFTALELLPNLQQCYLQIYRTAELMSLTDLLLLFGKNSSSLNIMLDISGNNNSLNSCEFIDLIRKIQVNYADLQVGFGEGFATARYNLVPVLSRSNVTVRLLKPECCHCGNSTCLNCPLLYPIVVNRIMVIANNSSIYNQPSQHEFDGYRLDRCKISSICQDLTTKHANGMWEATEVHLAEDGTAATILFKNLHDDKDFNLKLDCAHCLSYRCIKCENYSL